MGTWETIGLRLDTNKDDPDWAGLNDQMATIATALGVSLTNDSKTIYGRRIDLRLRRLARENPPPQRIYGTLTEKDSGYFEKVLIRANNVMLQAETVNMGQYSHGINTEIASIKWSIKSFDDCPPKSWDHDRGRIEKLADSTMKLAGYLHCLKSGL